MIRCVLAAALALTWGCAHAATPPVPPTAEWQTLSEQAEIRRTEFGIPHIRATSLRAAGFALAWVQLEDHGDRIISALMEARGETALRAGARKSALDWDFLARRRHARAIETFPLLPPDVRDIYEGFAAGVNRYIELHPEDVAGSVAPFTGADVSARDVGEPEWSAARRFSSRAPDGIPIVASWAAVTDEPEEGPGALDPEARLPGWEAGSNTWAFAPSRTKSGRAILMRNPHLSWTAGYYEAHVAVPGVLDFYGDFRLGGPFGMIGGFNARLGWSSTNNAPELSDIYALERDPARPDHYMFDGRSIRIERVPVILHHRTGAGVDTVTRERLETVLGPVFHQDDERLYIVRTGGDGAYRVGEQFFRMMTATTLEEWQEAMRIQARNASNFTYADADGNIFYVWNAAHPLRPHPHGGDTIAVTARGWDDVWKDVIAFDDLPQLLNPPGGYLRNENDPFHHTNLHVVLDPARFPPEFPEPRVRLRSQHSLALVHGDRRFSLEDVWEAKHSMGMLLADRVKDDLLAAVAETRPTGEVAAAARLLHDWDNTVAADARGGVLFVEWWARYLAGAGRARASAASAGFPAPAERLFREPWSLEDPAATPRGLADRERAAAAFVDAVRVIRERWGRWDIAWGEVHRARVGSLDLPVGGCDGLLGCFRILWFGEADDGKRSVRGGDGWVFAVEFGDTPRAYTVLAYGQSNRPGHPHSEDQLAMFVEGGRKSIVFTESDIEDALLRRYRPGAERRDGAGGAAFDLLLRDARVIDGSGAVEVRADVAIRDGRIAAVGALGGAVARDTVDVSGLYLVPGFIDTHSHAAAGLSTEALSDARPLLAQGVTTVLVNPDGSGEVDQGAQRLELLAHGLGVNVGQLVPHGAVRQAVLGMADRRPEPAELDRMRELVRRGMEAGAFGLSSGPYYAPGSYASTDELVALAEVVAGFGGVHQSHIRDEGDFTVGLLPAVDELIEISRRSGATGVVSHIKALGPRVWGQSVAVVERVERARAEGLRIYADQYPYDASATSLRGALVPRWALAGERDELQGHLRDPGSWDRLAADIAANLEGRGGPGRIQFRHHEPDPSLEGRTLEEVAAARGQDPVETVMDLLGRGGAGVVSFNMDEGDIVRFMRQPWTMTASDGEYVPLGQGVPHPRAYGTFPRKIARYAVEQGVIDLVAAIRSMTALPAAVYGIPDRGRVQPGMVADLVIFDLDRVRDVATYTDPHRYAEGMVHVLVGGRFAVRDGEFTGERAGDVLHRHEVER